MDTNTRESIQQLIFAEVIAVTNITLESDTTLESVLFTFNKKCAHAEHKQRLLKCPHCDIR